METEEFQVEVEELSFDVLDSTSKFHSREKKGWLPIDLLSYDLLLPDGTIISSAVQARFQSANETGGYEIALPLIASTPSPLRLDIKGLAFKKADSPLLYYHPVFV